MLLFWADMDGFSGGYSAKAKVPKKADPEAAMRSQDAVSGEHQDFGKPFSELSLDEQQVLLAEPHLLAEPQSPIAPKSLAGVAPNVSVEAGAPAARALEDGKLDR